MQYLLTQEEYNDISATFEKRIADLEKQLEEKRKNELDISIEIEQMERFTHVRIENNSIGIDPYNQQKRVSLQYDYNKLPENMQRKIDRQLMIDGSNTPKMGRKY